MLDANRVWLCEYSYLQRFFSKGIQIIHRDLGTERGWHMPLGVWRNSPEAYIPPSDDRREARALIDGLKNQVGTFQQWTVESNPVTGSAHMDQVVAVQRGLDKLQAHVDTEYERGHKDAIREIQDQKDHDQMKNIVIIGITVVLLLCGVGVVMLQRYDEKQKHWGYATLGTILGFWLR
jgi:hypothetical protein